MQWSGDGNGWVRYAPSRYNSGGSESLGHTWYTYTTWGYFVTAQDTGPFLYDTF